MRNVALYSEQKKVYFCFWDDLTILHLNVWCLKGDTNVTDHVKWTDEQVKIISDHEIDMSYHDTPLINIQGMHDNIRSWFCPATPATNSDWKYK